AEATGSRGRPRLSRARAQPDGAQAAAGAGSGSGRPGGPSRSRAQHRTRTFRASATPACLRRAPPPPSLAPTPRPPPVGPAQPPAALDQELAGAGRATPGDPPAAVVLARLELLGHPAAGGGHRLAALEPLRVVAGGAHRLGRRRAEPRPRVQQSDPGARPPPFVPLGLGARPPLARPAGGGSA